MDLMGELFQLAQRYSTRVDFVLIYISEAHPSDGWRMNSVYERPQHKTLANRLIAARQLLEGHFNLNESNIRLLVDGMDNAAQKAYGAFPDRLYVISRSTVVVQTRLKPPNCSDIANWLIQNKHSC